MRISKTYSHAVLFINRGKSRPPSLYSLPWGQFTGTDYLLINWYLSEDIYRKLTHTNMPLLRTTSESIYAKIVILENRKMIP